MGLHSCESCGFVSGDPTHDRTPEEVYRDYHRGPCLPAPNTRYREWLERAEGLVGRGRLLEVGAGGGGFVRAALSRGWDVQATEVSESALELLRKTGASVIAADVQAARLPRASFDFVVSLEVVEHLPAPLEHLRELGRVTRPGGLLLLSTPNYDGLSRRWLGLRWRVINPEHLGYFTKDTLARALEQAGFSSSQVETRSLDVVSWRRQRKQGASPYDPQAAARLRERVEGSRMLLTAKEAVNRVLRFTGLGDSLLAWARR